jgi:succinoglycan biosynthesis protein ExoA
MSVTVSIIVPCRNERSSIGSFLNGILDQDFEGIIPELLIADGLSDDGTRDIIRLHESSMPWTRLLDNPGKYVSAGLNLALREAKGEIVIRMDVHTTYAPDYVRECVRTLIETGAQNVGGPALTVANGYTQRAIAAAYSHAFACGGPRFHDRSYEGYVDTVTYGCWRKKTLEELGGFDEKLVRNQDDELNLRIIHNGGKIWQTPRIKSWYSPRCTLAALGLQYFQYGYWKVAVIRKHRLPASFRHLIPAAFVLFLMLGAIGSLLSLVDFAHWSAVPMLYASVLCIYALCDIAASAVAAAANGLSLFPSLLIVFPVYHLSYGTGSMLATFCALKRRHGGPSFVERLSR